MGGTTTTQAWLLLAAAVRCADSGSSTCSSALMATHCDGHGSAGGDSINHSCSVCAGLFQHQLRVAGCTAADITTFCAPKPSPAIPPFKRGETSHLS